MARNTKRKSDNYYVVERKGHYYSRSGNRPPRSRLFTVRNDEATYEQLPDGNIRAHSIIRSFKAVPKGKKKVLIYEVYRKGRKPTRRATIRNKAGISINESITRFRSYKRSKSIRVDFRHTNKYSQAYTSNQKPRWSMQNWLQLQLVANVRDNKTGVSDVYVGYSKAFKSYKGNDSRYVQAYQEAMDMCIAKFYIDHGLSKSGDAAVDVISKRYIVRREA